MQQPSAFVLCVALLAAGTWSVHAQMAPTPAAPTPTAMTTPNMAGPLAANPNPFKIDAGALGTWYVTGAVSGLFLAGNAVFPGDDAHRTDLDNGQVFIQKTDGELQFFVQAGAYSIPDLGAAYVPASSAIGDDYGALPQFFVKLAPSSAWSIEAGKLPTLVGDEYTFSFENMNIERGLLWNQEPAVSRGVQVDYTQGPVAAALSWNDGFYSNDYTWMSGSVTWTVTSADTLTLVGAGSTRISSVSTAATPILQNNGSIYNAIYTHTQGPWTLSPYLQYSSVPASGRIGTAEEGSTFGGALLVDYAFDSKSALNGWSLPVRCERISSGGSASGAPPNLLYGPSSGAWSLTVTPTYQHKIFYVRGEVSYVGITHGAPGDEFGAHGADRDQARLMIETGVLF